MTNFSALIADVASRHADHPAVEVRGTGGVHTTSYGNLVDSASRIAGWLSRQGVRRGDRVAILAGNSAAWIAAYLAALQQAAVAVPLDTAHSAAQVRTILDDAGARVLFTSARYLDVARAALATRETVIALLDGSAEGVVSSGDLAAGAADRAVAPVDAHTAAVILYTSGTTADPKGVVLTHPNLEAERTAVLAVLRAGPADVILGALPLFHALAQMANLLLPLSVGARVVFLETINSGALVDALQGGATIFACVPQFFYLIHERLEEELARRGWPARLAVRGLADLNGRLRDRLGWNPGRRWFRRVHRRLGASMRFFVTGGSAFDARVARDLYGLGFTLLNAYGLTETSGAATLMRPRDRFTASVGRPLPGVEVRIEARASDPAGASREAADGEILIRGPIVMREYFGRPDATAATLADGWLRTGDLGRLDASGRLHITGREKEIIVLSSGKNIYPEEIEAHYRQSPFIGEICVLASSRPGQPAAERLHAVIVPDAPTLREHAMVNVRERIRFELENLSAQLPPHKRVLSYDVRLEPLPRTTTGKIRRHEVAAHLDRRPETGADAARDLTADERAWLADPDRAAVLAELAARLRRPQVAPDANLELDLGLDSMERVELIAFLEGRHGRHVPPERRAGIFTVRQLIAAVREAPPTASPGAGEGWHALLSARPDQALIDRLESGETWRAALYFAAARLAGLVVRLWPGLRVVGRERLPRAGPFLLCPNHVSYFDGFVLAAALPFHVLRRLFFVGASEYFETPPMRRLSQLANLVPVDPDANLVSAMQAAAGGLDAGRVLVLFPEGERSIDGGLKTFRKGAAILSSQLAVPVVPVGLSGLWDLWPRGRRFDWSALRPGRARRVQVVFGDPLVLPDGDMDEAARLLRQRVAELLDSRV